MGQYSHAVRVKQLHQLRQALVDFISVIDKTHELSEWRSAYEQSLVEVDKLIEGDFDQAALSALSRAIPKLFWVHKEWIPPLTLTPDGRWEEPLWFKEANSKHQEVTDLAFAFRVVG